MSLVLRNIVRFAFLVLLQVFVVKEIDLGFLNSYLSISIYISFILTFPIKVSNYLLLFSAFLIGISIDLFMNTGGIHASASVAMAFARPFLLRRLQSESPMDETLELTVFTEDSQKYILYSFLLSFVFFFWLFLLEEFSLKAIPLLFLKSILSSIISAILIIIGQYLLFRKPKI